MHIYSKSRGYFFCGILVTVSLSPWILTLPLFGVFNFLYSAMLWFLFFILIKIFNGMRLLPIVFLFSLFNSIPPVPTYMGTSSIYFHFIGFDEILNDKSVLFLMPLNFLCFIGVATLYKKHTDKSIL
jgi:hypothetical protein